MINSVRPLSKPRRTPGRGGALFATVSASAMLALAAPSMAQVYTQGTAELNPSTYVPGTDIIVTGGTADTPAILKIPDDGGATLVTGSVFVGQDANTTGQVDFGESGGSNGPVVSISTGDGRLTAGNSGLGTVNIWGDAEVTSNYLVVGWQSSGEGILNISGAGTSYTVNAVADVGLFGKATVTVSDGATLTSNGQFWLGRFGDANSTLTVTGAGSVLNHTSQYSDFDVGGRDGTTSQGHLIVSDGGAVYANRFTLGLVGTGTATVDGEGSLLEAATQSSGIFLIAEDSRGNGTLTVSNGGTARSGLNGTGTINLARFGTGSIVVGSLNDAAHTGAGYIDAALLQIGANGSLVFSHNETAADNYEFTAAIAGNNNGSGTIRSLAGRTTLTGDSSAFAGQTIVDGGNLVLANNLGGTVTINSGGTFTLADGGNYTGALTDNGTLAFEYTTDATVNRNFTGTGGLAMRGAGTVTLTGTNTLTGTVSVESGTLAGTASSLGLGTNYSVTGGTLAVSDAFNLGGNGASTATVSGGNAELTASSLTVGAATGGTSVLSLANGGTVSINNGAGILNVGTIANGNATTGKLVIGSLSTPSAATGGVLDVASVNVGSAGELVFSHKGTANSALSFNTTVTGSGTLRSSAGYTLLSSDLSGFTGQTIVDGGNLVLDTALSTAVTINQGGTFTLTDVSNFTGNLVNSGTLAINTSQTKTIDASFSGTGRLQKDGVGTLTLTGTNALTGGLVVNAGILEGTLASLGTGAYNVTGGTLKMDVDSDGTLSSVLNGAGAIEKTGAGKLTYTGNGTGFTGGLDIQAGSLSLNGSLGGLVTVEEGATLYGIGSLGGLNLKSGGVLAPGNSVGTLTVAGNATFSADSTYVVEINAAGGSDLLTVGGTATLNGATVKVVKLSSDYLPGTSYTILTATGGVVGTFSGPVQEDAPFLDLSLNYTGTTVKLDIARALDFSEVAETPNEQAVASAANALGEGNAVYDALLVSADTAAARAGFNDLSGELHASARTAAVETTRLLRDAVQSRLESDTSGVWVQDVSNWAASDGEAGTADLKRDTAGLILGADTTIGSGDWRAGVALGYTDTSLSAASVHSTGHVKTVHLLGYAARSYGPVALRLGAGYGATRNKIDRAFTVSDFSDQTKASYDGHLAQAFGEVGYPLLVGKATVEPFGNLAYIYTDAQSFKEDGGAAALDGTTKARGNALSTIGFRTALPVNDHLSGRLSAAWQHAYGTLQSASVVNFASETESFTSLGATLSRDALVISLEGRMQLSSGLELSAGYSGSAGAASYDSSAHIRAGYKF